MTTCARFAIGLDRCNQSDRTVALHGDPGAAAQ